MPTKSKIRQKGANTMRANVVPISSKLMSPADAAAYLGVRKRTLVYWRACGTGPKFLKITNRMIRYEIDELNKFITSVRSGG